MIGFGASVAEPSRQFAISGKTSASALESSETPIDVDPTSDTSAPI